MVLNKISKHYPKINHIRLMNEDKIRRHDLEILRIGKSILLLCKVSILNPSYRYVKKVDCDALIDTGSDISFVSQKVFDMLSIDIDEVFIKKQKINPISGDSIELNKIPIGICVPDGLTNCFIKDCVIDEMSEPYEVILGMDIISKLVLHVDIENNETYIMY